MRIEGNVGAGKLPPFAQTKIPRRSRWKVIPSATDGCALVCSNDGGLSRAEGLGRTPAYNNPNRTGFGLERRSSGADEKSAPTGMAMRDAELVTTSDRTSRDAEASRGA